MLQLSGNSLGVVQVNQMPLAGNGLGMMQANPMPLAGPTSHGPQVTSYGASLGTVQMAPVDILNGMLGFGASEDELDAIAKRLKSSTEGEFPSDAVREISAAMSILPSDEQKSLAEKLLALGVPAEVVRASLTSGQAKAVSVFVEPKWRKYAPLYGWLATASVAANTYHGYRRNKSLPWALWWGLMGAAFPVLSTSVAFAQGFGERK